jgi:hypothetical protein
MSNLSRDDLEIDISNLIGKYADQNMCFELINSLISNAVMLKSSLLYEMNALNEIHRNMSNLVIEHIEYTKMLMSELECG